MDQTIDYTSVLNSINSNLSAILEFLSGSKTSEFLNYIFIILTIFLILYILRGE